jgi:propionyl-CoA synthetase
MRDIADGRVEAVPSTIEDASVLDALRPVLRRHDAGAPAAKGVR